MALIAQRKQSRHEAEAFPPTNSGMPQPETGNATTPTGKDVDDIRAQTLPRTAELPSGFKSSQEWQEALEAAHTVSNAARRAGHPDGDLDTSMQEMTAETLALAVVRAVLPLQPIQAVSLLLQCQKARLAVLPPRQAARAQALIKGAPNQLPPDDGMEQTPEDPVAETAWRLYAEFERLRHARATAEQQRRLLNYLPLPVIDDLVDAGRVTPNAIPESGAHQLYLRARLAPADINQEGLVALNWHDELARRDMNARLARGDLAALDGNSQLTTEQRRLAAALRSVRHTGAVPPELARERWLWSALERLAPNAPVNLRKDKAYAPWMLVRRIYRAIREVHQARLRGDEQKYRTMLITAWNDATALQGSWTAAGWEARNALAYLLVFRGENNPKYDKSLDILSPAPGQALREHYLPQEAQHHIIRNREILNALKGQHKGPHMLNPYLVLGVPDGSPAWKERWRALRSSLDPDGEAQVNEAKDSIQMWERGRAPIAPFTLPLMPDKWASPQVGTSIAASGAMPMPRKTRPATADETEFARSQAAHGIVETARDHVRLLIQAKIKQDDL
ncbi:hypothetical protein GBF35_46185 [Nonomuraea phyllanthi]|uniref:hypothetical protein n=1 Tax=Nonomuraea phyllanthi TaxID=2219224 RepID=UPI001292D748|nr:hypothetical protein [Nonomuraea phyllanthi]QFY12972.1 hypothetical protein GBF35_46185 [Nonomuraea phyllanthi]